MFLIQSFMSLDLRVKLQRAGRDEGGSGRQGGRPLNVAQRAWVYLLIRKLQRKSLESTNGTVRTAALASVLQMSQQVDLNRDFFHEMLALNAKATPAPNHGVRVFILVGDRRGVWR